MAFVSLMQPLVFCFLFYCLITVTLTAAPVEFSHISRILDLHDKEGAPPPVQEAAAQGVLRRLLPSHSSSFEFQIVSKDTCGGVSCFVIQDHPFSEQTGSPEILVKGVTAVELSSGLYWYLKNWCMAHVSWEMTGGMQLSSIPKPGHLPRVGISGVTVTRPVPWSYYQNAVTSSYSFPWWDWKRWEKEIDWMALQGVNMPLAPTGQEAIWQKVFKIYNISGSDLHDFFGGPAFLAWSRMGNLHGWGGPLPQGWLDQQLLLQKKILARMFELGMYPVLPSFSGNIPSALRFRFPSAKITRLGNWFTVSNNPKWCCTYLLDPTDPLFTEIGKAFVEKQLKEYGRTSHIYNCDTFDENTPPVSSPVYISSLGAAIYEGIRSGDNEAIWLMQGWLFSYDPFWKPPQMKALLHSVPYGRLVVLDLYAEVKPIWVVTEQFYGVPYIWCMLHNFAGNHEMYGILDEISRGPVEARLSNHSTLVGVGMSMEGIEQNPIVYDLMSEMAFHHEKVDPKVWVDLYSQRRYGNIVPAIQDAWKILHHTLYNCTDGLYDKNRDVIVAFPDVHPSSIPLSGFSKFGVEALELPHLWYSTSDVLKALYIFLANGEELLHINTFRYDLIDLTRQALAKHANENFLEIIRAYRLNDPEAVRSYSRNFLDLVEDLDLLLSCHEGFLLGPWLESAKLLAEGSEQKILYEWNARTLITMWFDNTDVEASLLRDYGNKYWSGLLLDYYKPRAAIYFNYLVESLEEGNSFSLEDWRRDWVSLTNEWQRSRKPFRVKASGDALNISRWLYEKYFGSIISKVELQSITQLTVL